METKARDCSQVFTSDSKCGAVAIGRYLVQHAGSKLVLLRHFPFLSAEFFVLNKNGFHTVVQQHCLGFTRIRKPITP